MPQTLRLPPGCIPWLYNPQTRIGFCIRRWAGQGEDLLRFQTSPCGLQLELWQLLHHRGDYSMSGAAHNRTAMPPGVPECDTSKWQEMEDVQ